MNKKGIDSRVKVELLCFYAFKPWKETRTTIY